MPIVSKAQNRLMQAAARGKAKADVPKEVAKEFVKAGAKRIVRNLPERKFKKKD